MICQWQTPKKSTLPIKKFHEYKSILGIGKIGWKPSRSHVLTWKGWLFDDDGDVDNNYYDVMMMAMFIFLHQKPSVAAGWCQQKKEEDQKRPQSCFFIYFHSWDENDIEKDSNVR